MKRHILAIILALSLNTVFAQDFFDALRYSKTDYNSTARSMAMGNAFGALGADFISASINPAGLGLYRSSELAITPTLNINQIEATYLGNAKNHDDLSFTFNNLSYVGHSKTGNTTGVLDLTFGLGINRIKNFNSNIYIQGNDATTTLLNYFTDYANEAGNANNFDYHYEGLAWNTWLINEDENPEVLEGAYYNDLAEYNQYEIYDTDNNYLGIGYETAGVKPHQQEHIASLSGNITEYSASLGMNINHKVFVGGSVALNSLNYFENISYSEIDNNNKSDYFKDFKQKSYLSESGLGANFKLGVIFRPIKSLRLGASIHTPTYYDITRYSDKSIVANYDQEIGNDALGYSKTWDNNNERSFDYKLETPLKANASIAFLFGTRALLSADYEYVAYNSASFDNVRGDNYDYSSQNLDIKGTLKSANNLRIGGEFKLTNTFSLRAGYNIVGNPWQNAFISEDGSSSEIVNSIDTFSAYTAGFGYRNQNFFIDFAYKLNQSKTTYKVHEASLRVTDGANLSTLNELNNQTSITFGYRF